MRPIPKLLEPTRSVANVKILGRCVGFGYNSVGHGTISFPLDRVVIVAVESDAGPRTVEFHPKSPCTAAAQPPTACPASEGQARRLRNLTDGVRLSGCGSPV